MKSMNAQRCILVVVVVTLVFMEAWNTTAARSSTTTICEAVRVDPTAAFDLATPASGGAIVLDATSNVRLEALPDPTLTAGAASTFAPPGANLDQIRNGSAASPVSPANWVNGNAGASQAHYAEGYSIPYRTVMTELPTGTTITLTLGYDIKHSDKNALDYLTHFDRIDDPTGSHQLTFGHPPEVINPLIGVSGVSSTTTTFPIPAPSSAGSPVPGQPTTSFNALPAGDKVMTLFGGTITNVVYVTEGSLTAAQSETQIAVTFTVDSATAVLAWAGHIASRVDWGFEPDGDPRSAGGISGSPYHMRLKDWNLGNLGNQDRSLAAEAVFVPCATCSVDTTTSPVCPGSTNTHTSTIDTSSGVCDSPVHNWTISGNGVIVGPTNGSSVVVLAGNTCNATYTITDNVTCSGCTGVTTVTCSKTVNVADTTPPTVTFCPSNATIQCPATPVFGTPTFSDNCDPNLTITVNDVTTPGSCPGTFSRTRTTTATDDCGNSVSCSQTITVVDTTPPLIGQPGANTTIECPATPVFTPPTATDACDPNPAVIEVSDVTTPGNCPGTFTRTKTWRATDACGNMSTTVSQTITVVDTTPPTITCPPGVTVQCLADVPPPVTSGIASDTCGSVTISSTDVNSPGPCGPACGGRIVRTYTATDACGNTASCTQTITYGIPPPLPPPGAIAQGMQELIEKLLSSGDLVVGELGARSLTIPGGSSARSSASCLLSRLPVDGSTNALEDFGDKTLDPATCQTSPSLELQENGTWRSLLLGQTISLALNLRADAYQQRLRPARTINLAPDQRSDVDFALGSLLLTSTVWSQRASPGLDGILGTGDDELDPSSARMQFVIPASVLSALGPNATVPDLLKLANSALAGHQTGDAAISDLTAALDAINRSFDFGRRRRLVNLSRPAR